MVSDFFGKIKTILDGWKLKYKSSESNTIYFDIAASRCNKINVVINIEATPKPMCIVNLQYPFTIEKYYSYFAYKRINNINKAFKLGTYFFDSTTGIVSCAYTLLCSERFDDDFQFVLLEMLVSFDRESESFLNLSNGNDIKQEYQELRSTLFSINGPLDK